MIAGIDWKPGDEAVMAAQDYGAMLDMFKLQAKRYGIVNTIVSLPLDPKSDNEIVQLYENAITPKTRLLMVCHMVNITGQILPVRAIVDMAHRKGVEVMVDGAHAFAQIDYRIPDLACDYYGASLHKWLGTPLGAGILYVRADRIAKLWPIYADASMADTDIRKLNHTGTHPVHTDLAIENAIAFHEMIGIGRKEARLRYIQNYWTSRVRGTPKIVLNTPADPKRSCAIANVGIIGIPPAALAKTLLDKYRVWTVAIDTANVHGVRITPQVFTTTAELDTFVRALKVSRLHHGECEDRARVGSEVPRDPRARPACAKPCAGSRRARITSARRTARTTRNGCATSSSRTDGTRTSRSSRCCSPRRRNASSRWSRRRSSPPSSRSRRSRKEDPTSGQKSEQLPTYNAYSADGDVTAPLVYVNYGVPADYDELERHGVSVKGAIVIARYGGSWRGIKPKVAYEHGAGGLPDLLRPEGRRLFAG